MYCTMENHYDVDFTFLLVHLTSKSELCLVLQACFKIMSHTNTNQWENFLTKYH